MSLHQLAVPDLIMPLMSMLMPYAVVTKINHDPCPRSQASPPNASRPEASEVKDLGYVKHILGMKGSRDRALRRLTISQKHYLMVEMQYTFTNEMVADILAKLSLLPHPIQEARVTSLRKAWYCRASSIAIADVAPFNKSFMITYSNVVGIASGLMLDGNHGNVTQSTVGFVANEGELNPFAKTAA
nr:hypothetical protein CFP56_00439 [Quercus suber]